MNGFALNTVTEIYIGNQLASAVYCGSNLIWEAHNYTNDWFTIEAIDNCDITFTLTDMEIFYSIGDPKTEGWAGQVDSENNTISLQSGEITCLGGIYDKIDYTNPIGTINSTGRFKVYGNIMSLLTCEKSQGDINGSTEYADFRNLTDLSSYPTYIFSKLFENCTYLVDASNLVLPATTLVQQCYISMFAGCTSLTKAPKILPATTLTDYCYNTMFNGCTALTTAPKLPATTLAQYCYVGMFNGCTSLSIAPVLPATTLAISCYANMFYNCTSLITAPTLPATTLASACYQGMFNGCSSLNYIKCLATNLGTISLTYWVNGVAATGTFIKATSNTSWKINNVSGIPSGWTIYNEDGTIYTLPAAKYTVSYVVTSQKSGMTYSVSNDNKTYVLNGNSINSGTLLLTLTITASESVNLTFTVTPSSESNYDFGCVGTLDSANTLGRNSNAWISTSGTTIASNNVVVSAGTHTIQIGYFKDTSVNNNDDKATITITEVV